MQVQCIISAVLSFRPAQQKMLETFSLSLIWA
jgi:hypothetical protein